MNRQPLIVVTLSTMLSICSTVTIAAERCSNWVAHGNGVELRQCVRDDGTTYCQERHGSKILNVRCS